MTREVEGGPVLTLEARRTPVLRLFAVQEALSSVSRTDQSISIGLLEEAWLAEGRPTAEFIAWLVCGADEAGGGIMLTKPVAYERRHAYMAIKAGIKVAQDGGTETYSHLVHAGMRLHGGETQAEVQAAADAGLLKRKPSASTPGLSKIQFPDTHLDALETIRLRVQNAFKLAGYPLPENAPEVLAGLLDLIGHLGDRTLNTAALEAVGGMEKYLRARIENARMVTLVALTAEGDSLPLLVTTWGSKYVNLLNAERPTWSVVQVREDGQEITVIIREDGL